MRQFSHPPVFWVPHRSWNSGLGLKNYNIIYLIKNNSPYFYYSHMFEKSLYPSSSLLQPIHWEAYWPTYVSLNDFRDKNNCGNTFLILTLPHIEPASGQASPKATRNGLRFRKKNGLHTLSEVRQWVRSYIFLSFFQHPSSWSWRRCFGPWSRHHSHQNDRHHNGQQSPFDPHRKRLHTSC